jgi:DNA-binding CsgD family transcriptional regulator
MSEDNKKNGIAYTSFPPARSGVVTPGSHGEVAGAPITGVGDCLASPVIVSDNFVADPLLEAALSPKERRAAPAPRADPLAPREREVMRFVVQGESNDRIASMLNLRTVTVTKTLTRVYRKLGVRNRAEAVRRYMQLREEK